MYRYKLLSIMFAGLLTGCGSIQINIASSSTIVVAPKLQHETKDSTITGSDLKGNSASQDAGDIKPTLP